MKSKDEYFETPILLIIFNRTGCLKKVFSEIEKIRPTKLYIAADGPRENKEGEKEKCDEARKITEKISWKCEVDRLYRDKNLGCKNSVSSAIDWFFGDVEEGIILEDDCLPDPTFFKFCEYMLGKYKNDNRLMHIGGDNFLNTLYKTENSYYFSQYPHVWGWATWRRAWKYYDVDMKDWDNIKTGKLISIKFWNKIEKHYWYIIFDAVKKGKINTWDYQWFYTILKNNGICINPGSNLVENIGFNGERTHVSFRRKFPSRDVLTFPLVGPVKEEISYKFDKFTSKYHFRHNILTLMYVWFKYRYL